GLDVPLGETGPATGEFSGEAPFASPGGNGVLAVKDGDVATATYDDLDDGTGAPATRTSSVTIGDCTAPTISSVILRRITNDTLEVRWKTNEPATSLVDVSPAGASFTSAGLTTDHRVIASGLQACGASAVTITSTDAAGNVAVDAGAGGGYDVEPSRDVTIFSEDFETGAPGWEHYGDPDQWEIGVPQSGPGSAYSGTSVAATNLDGTYDKDPYRQRRTMLLVSPSISLRGLPSATLTVNHWYRFAPDTRGDGGIVEVLSGGRWHRVGPSGGYTGAIRTNRSDGTEPAFVNFSTGWVQSRFDLSPWVGGPIRFRFRMVVDEGTPDREDGWYLDSISVTAPAPCHRGILQLDREGYGCGPGEARVLLTDADLDQSPASVDTASVIASDGGAPVSVGLTETGPATGVFTGSIPFSPSGGAAALRATQGGTFEVVYEDADDGSGFPATDTVDGSFADCTPPILSAVSSELPGGGSDLELHWTTDEPATTEAVLTVNGSPRTYASADLSRQHAAFFPGLPDCTAYSAVIASGDATGNRSSLTGSSPPFEGESRKYTYLMWDDMDGQSANWSTTASGAGWQRGVPVVGPPGAFSGTQVFGTNLTGVYEAGTNDTLRTPVIDLTAVPSATFSFWHFYDIFAKGSPNAEDDGGWIEVIDTADSVVHYVVPDDGYSNTVDRDGSPPIKGGSGVFAGKSEGYLHSTLDLTPWLGKRIWLQFHIWNDVVEGPFNRATGAGWYVDDVAVRAPGACFQPPAITSITAPPLAQGASGVEFSVSGSDLRSPLLFDAGAGLTFHDLAPGQAGSFTGMVDVSPGAATGRRDLIVRNPDGQSATLPDALEVIFGAGRADIDGSGVVDGGDLARLAAAFGSFRGEPAYDEDADLDGDGVVDGSDLALLASSFGQVIGP
ncbi:MAG TPA: dockerin type I domain-containing protein, partial [Candidatus Saccharimonadales bacterium]|nr:dockerin type I domain-containing protein [Candidatus Saccharimonadales bacterium]